MPVKPNIWMRKAKARLMEEMGGCCWKCGSTTELEIDHPFGRDWKPREKSSNHRVCIYRREWKEKRIQILCSTCNGSRPGHVLYPAPAGVDAEFRAEPALAEHGAENIPF